MRVAVCKVYKEEVMSRIVQLRISPRVCTDWATENQFDTLTEQAVIMIRLSLAQVKRT